MNTDPESATVSPPAQRDPSAVSMATPHVRFRGRKHVSTLP